MFIGRECERDSLKQLYTSDKFGGVVNLWKV